jgi:3-oxoacyl-[acyl-carrier-protein] synthase II
MKPRALTGLGIVSSAGIGREAFFRAMRERVPLAARPPRAIVSFDAARYPDAKLAEVPDFEPAKFLGDKGLRTLDRLTKLLVVGARLAMHDAGIKKDGVYVATSPERTGLCCSNAYGSLEAITELDRVAKLEDARYINPAKFPNTVSNSASGYVSIWEDLRALNVTVSDGNCGALDAIACADVYLETGRADCILVGGGEALSEALYLAFCKLGALGGDTSRVGEGAVLMALEPLELAVARGATIRGEVVGYGTAFSAPESEHGLIHASSDAMQRAIATAIADAQIAPKDIDVVASGVSGLADFDARELEAIARGVGPAVCVAAPKELVGETLGASGGMGVAAGLAWFDGAPPAKVIRGEAPAEVRTVLVTSMGFYGNASAVVIRRAR